MVEFTKEFQRFFMSGCRLSYSSDYVPLQNRSKRLPVLRDQNVLPEVRNRPLLPRENFKSRTLKKWLRIQLGNPPFHRFNIRYTHGSKLQLEKFLGGWCVVSCKSIQFPKFKVQAQGYAIRYVMGRCLMYHYILNCIPVCLNRKFRKLCRRAAHDIGTQSS